jgi:hypothetical protein
MAQLQWLWQYANQDGGRPIGQGRLFTKSKPNQNGYYRVTAIKGTVDGVKIDSLLPAGRGIPGNVDPITGTPYLGDNKIRPRSLNPNKPQLTDGGIVFSLKDESYSNLFYGAYPPTPSYYEFHTVPPYPDGLVEPNTESLINFSAWISNIG